MSHHASRNATAHVVIHSGAAPVATDPSLAVRRHTDGAIDFDAYRAEAASARRAAMTAFLWRLMRSVVPRQETLIFPSSFPAQAGNPVRRAASDPAAALAFTGSSAFAEDDNREDAVVAAQHAAPSGVTV